MKPNQNSTLTSVFQHTETETVTPTPSCQVSTLGCDALQILPKNIEWNRIYENNYLGTNETKLRSFQIRLNMKSIVTNVQINGMGIVDNKHFAFCSKDSETIIHLFCKCKFVDDFWQDLSD